MIITSQQAQTIINAACSAWKQSLADKWAVNIVKNENVYIENKFYDEMRVACTIGQHAIFDEIFGPYKIQECPVKVGDHIRFLQGYDGQSIGTVVKITSVQSEHGDWWIKYNTTNWIGGGQRVLSKKSTNPGYTAEKHFHVLDDKEVALLDYKAGDYIYILKDEANVAQVKAGDILQIESLNKSYVNTTKESSQLNLPWSITPENFRKATPEEIALLDYKVDDYVYILKDGADYANVKAGDVYQIDNIVNKTISAFDRLLECSWSFTPENIRKATPEEIKQALWYPHLTPCLVKNSKYDGYSLRYSSHKVNEFYDDGTQQGSTTNWSLHQILNINNLPVNIKKH